VLRISSAPKGYPTVNEVMPVMIQNADRETKITGFSK
jgi:hypothetical protein